jgi:hypothetical protein
MFAVRIDIKKRGRPKTDRGCVWVKSINHQYYVPITERALFKTREEAERAKNENWEIIVEV